MTTRAGSTRPPGTAWWFARVREPDQARNDAHPTMWAVQTWNVHPYRLILSYQPLPAPH